MASVSMQRMVLAALCATSLGASAQVYRIVGPDGKVTFSDRPPAETAAKPAAAAPAGGNTANAGGGLPYDVRTAAGKYPVTLYTGTDCAPCNSARNFLSGRGIPYSEKTVSTNDDAAALRKLSGEVRVPFLTIGGQQLHGYSETEWSQYLDAAGYPKASKLPSGYRNPAPTPMVAVQQAQPAAAAAAPQAPAVAPVPDAPPATTADNPAGIRF
ncbi:glutaredoxin family protein [Ramlibacter sp. G-1-2-2]|uniref:Glutaredoxin family protein n=1 Tax=Ramlibacter agri TaxID=2728837 RepID=A0A848HF08_9BURK|nr:glutaredoxin domain-containing protein [Ramlibacter agri]NML48060.1 glutaredoxin family protein [Ramlibacter agri]